jgi:hypothetical protein
MLVRLFLTILMVLAPVALSASTEGWYQVELIVFANNAVTDTDEVWPLSERHYPEAMVRIGPQSADQLKPETLGQLNDLQRYLGMWAEDQSSAPPTTSSSSDFLFESRSKPRLNQSFPITDNTSAVSSDEITADTPDLQDLSALFTEPQVIAFQELPGNERLLNGVARSLNRSSLYRLLVHQSWLQPVAAEHQATSVLVQGGKRYDDRYELDGTITLSRSRFLHLQTDLWFTQFSPLSEASSGSTRAPGMNLSPLDGSLAIPPEIRRDYPEVATWLSTQNQYTPIHAHELRQSRRMRSSTMHFIDHPQFGVLIRTERYEPDQDS